MLIFLMRSLRFLMNQGLISSAKFYLLTWEVILHSSKMPVFETTLSVVLKQNSQYTSIVLERKMKKCCLEINIKMNYIFQENNLSCVELITICVFTGEKNIASFGNILTPYIEPNPCFPIEVKAHPPQGRVFVIYIVFGYPQLASHMRKENV